MDSSSPIPSKTTCWIGSGVVAALLVLAGLLAATGRTTEGLRLALVAMLAPGLVLFAVWLVALVRQPAWYRSAHRVTALLLLAGSLLLLVPVLIRIQYEPASWNFAELPPYLLIPAVVGFVFFTIWFMIAMVVGITDLLASTGYGRRPSRHPSPRVHGRDLSARGQATELADRNGDRALDDPRWAGCV
jgi:hypothetical protein